jgi:hypothetical protein
MYYRVFPWGNSKYVAVNRPACKKMLYTWLESTQEMKAN